MTQGLLQLGNMLQKVLPCTKVLLQVTLIVLFLYYFGEPGLKRFQDKQTTIVTSEELTEGIEAPAISFQAGWKSSEIGNTLNVISPICGQADNITQCILDKTFDLNETVLYAGMGFEVGDPVKNGESLMGQELWTEDFTTTLYGRFYTINFRRIVGPNYIKDCINFLLNENMTYYTFIHDKLLSSK